jgi:hypothetical protein
MFARRILRKHDAACGKSADVTIARLEFHLTREPDHKHTVRWVVPAHLAHARRDVTLHLDAVSVSVRCSGGSSLKSFLGCNAMLMSCMWVSPLASAKIRRHVTRS